MKTKLFYLIVLSLIFLGCKDEAKENNSISLEKFVTLEGIDNAVNLNTVDNTVIFSREVDSLATLVGNQSAQSRSIHLCFLRIPAVSAGS